MNDTQVLGTVEVKGKQYAIVESAMGGYINGEFSRYLLVPLAAVPKNIPSDQMVEVVLDS